MGPFLGALFANGPLAVAVLGLLALAGTSVGFATAWLRARERAIRAEAQLAAGQAQLLGAATQARFDRLEQLGEATALEVERVAEAQRFQAKLLAARVSEAAARPSLAPGRVTTPH